MRKKSEAKKRRVKRRQSRQTNNNNNNSNNNDSPAKRRRGGERKGRLSKDEDVDDGKGEGKGQCRSCLGPMVVVLSPGPADRCCEILDELYVPGTNNENNQQQQLHKKRKNYAEKFIFAHSYRHTKALAKL